MRSRDRLGICREQKDKKNMPKYTLGLKSIQKDRKALREPTVLSNINPKTCSTTESTTNSLFHAVLPKL